MKPFRLGRPKRMADIHPFGRFIDLVARYDFDVHVVDFSNDPYPEDWSPSPLGYGGASHSS